MDPFEKMSKNLLAFLSKQYIALYFQILAHCDATVAQESLKLQRDEKEVKVHKYISFWARFSMCDVETT